MAVFGAVVQPAPGLLPIDVSDFHHGRAGPKTVGDDRLRPAALTPLATDLAHKHRAKPVPPEPHRLVADVDAVALEALKGVLTLSQLATRHGVHRR